MEEFPLTQICSFPRSGSTVFTDILLKNFASTIKFGGFGETTLYNKEINLFRSHNLSMKINKEIKYIILYRQPVRTITSYFFKAYPNAKTNLNRENFEKFSKDHAKRWMDFTKFWVIKQGNHKGTTSNKVRSNFFFVYYDELIQQTDKLFNHLHLFLFNTVGKIDASEIKSRDRLVGRLTTTKLRPDMLDNLEERCRGRIEELGLKNWRDSE